jgi:hypothetical protein
MERYRYVFYVELLYEKLPHFGHNCGMIGHPISQCKKLQIQNDEAGGTGDCKGQNNENVPKK